MIMRTRNYLGAPLLAAFFICAFAAAGSADDLFRLYPVVSLSGLYGTRLSNLGGDFAGTLAGGFYLDYTSAARFASLNYDTFAQLLAHQSRYDRAGEGQYVAATDDERLSRTTQLRLREVFLRDSRTVTNIVASDQVPQFNSMASALLLANERASANGFYALLEHEWGYRWSSALSVDQEIFWSNGSNSNNISFGQSIGASALYHFSEHLFVGPGYRFSDSRDTAPGRPAEERQEPFLRAMWYATKNLRLAGRVGVLISHTQGSSRETVGPSGEGLLEYNLDRVRLKLYGGQEAVMSSGLGAAGGNTRYVRGKILYDFTERLVGNAGGGFTEFQATEHGTGIDAQLISWGFGLTHRTNEWLEVFARFTQLYRKDTNSRQFLPAGLETGRQAVDEYVVVGFAVSIEAFRWSWQ
jgi:hypothetical protein